MALICACVRTLMVRLHVAEKMPFLKLVDQRFCHTTDTKVWSGIAVRQRVSLHAKKQQQKNTTSNISLSLFYLSKEDKCHRCAQ